MLSGKNWDILQKEGKLKDSLSLHVCDLNFLDGSWNLPVLYSKTCHRIMEYTDNKYCGKCMVFHFYECNTIF